MSECRKEQSGNSIRATTATATATYTQAQAEQSKNYVLSKVNESTDKLESFLLLGYYSSIFTIAISLVMIMIIVFVIVVLIMVYSNIITRYKALIAFLLWFVFVIVMAIIFVTYSYRFTEKRIKAGGEVYKNFIASERIPVIIDTAAGIYLKTATT